MAKVCTYYPLFSFGRPKFYQPPEEKSDFICSLPKDSGMARCSSLSHFYAEESRCNGSFVPGNMTTPNSSCVNWNQYYDTCRQEGPNPFYDNTSFDNIGIAWIVIFQVI